MSGNRQPDPAGVDLDAVLEVRDLRTYFVDPDGDKERTARAVDGVSLRLRPGETLGLVGESGCGKSVTALSILQLLPVPPARIMPGSSVRLGGTELVGASVDQLRAIRGGEVGMIFQEPMTSLNPVLRVGDQVAEAIRQHRTLDRKAVRAEVVSLLARVGIADPERRLRAHPHQLSGGQRQRVMIAMAIASRPSVLIADEPTTALDVTIQAQILELLASLQDEFGMALLFISHDLAVVAQVADRVAVMYGGQIVEEATSTELFSRPRHPYTEGLLLAVPDVEAPRDRLAVIPGRVPHASRWPSGCRFEPRCPYRWTRCETPPDLSGDGGAAEADPAGGVVEHAVRCWLREEPGRRGTDGFQPDPGAGPAPGGTSGSISGESAS
jgi:peptide/nickel transport system ATP-binding protein/oligopeptide transport system ATP-binding protein